MYAATKRIIKVAIKYNVFFFILLNKKFLFYYYFELIPRPLLLVREGDPCSNTDRG
jgi:hypothetical protein